MIFVAVYFGIGIALSIWVLVRRPKPRNVEFGPLSFLAEPTIGWALFLFWPLWIFVQLAEQGDEVPAAPQEYVSESLEGKLGEVMIELRPMGRIRIAGKIYDARSDEDILGVGTRVLVTHSRIGELRVRKAVGVEPVPQS